MKRSILFVATLLLVACSTPQLNANELRRPKHFEPELFTPLVIPTSSPIVISHIQETPSPTKLAIKQPSSQKKLVLKPTEKPSLPKVVANTSPKKFALQKIGQKQFNCLEPLWDRESNWNYKAYNRSSGAYGIPQALPGSKMASAGEDWKTNPITQVRWGINYVNSRYGSACSAWNFWKREGWY